MNIEDLKERRDGIRAELRKAEKMEEHVSNAWSEMVRVLDEDDPLWDELDDLVFYLRDAQTMLYRYLNKTRKEYSAQRKIEKGA